MVISTELKVLLIEQQKLSDLTYSLLIKIEKESTEFEDIPIASK